MPELPPPPTSPASPASRLVARATEAWGSLPLRIRIICGAALGLGLASLAVAGLFLGFGTQAGGAPPGRIDLPRATSKVPAGAEPVFAHAAGAVAHPGLYKLPAGSRVADLVQAAGGPVEGADIDQLNLAAVVNDGERVYVPRRGEADAGEMAAAGAGAAGGAGARVDLNAATQAQLEDLPGVGPATAAAILDERKRRGRFKRVEDLLEVRGIGPAKFEQLRSLVRV